MAIISVKSVATKFMSKAEESSQLTFSNPATGKAIPAYQYPLSITGAEDRHPSYLVFYAVKPRSEGSIITSGMTAAALERKSDDKMTGTYKEDTACVIQMYMPNMMENMNHSYDSKDSNFFTELVAKFGKARASSGSTTEAIAETLGSAADLVINEVVIKGAKLANEYANTDQSLGVVLGDRAVKMYKSTDCRQQTFIFQLRPRNLAELKEVGNILIAFHTLSSASNLGDADLQKALGSRDVTARTIGSAVLDIPHLWYIEERINKQSGNSASRYTPKFAMGPAVITNIRMNKTPDQIYETFSNTAGDPIAIDLEMTIQELRPTFANHWKALGDKLGQPDSGDFFFGSMGGNK